MVRYPHYGTKLYNNYIAATYIRTFVSVTIELCTYKVVLNLCVGCYVHVTGYANLKVYMYVGIIHTWLHTSLIGIVFTHFRYIGNLPSIYIHNCISVHIKFICSIGFMCNVATYICRYVYSCVYHSLGKINGWKYS